MNLKAQFKAYLNKQGFWSDNGDFDNSNFFTMNRHNPKKALDGYSPGEGYEGEDDGSLMEVQIKDRKILVNYVWESNEQYDSWVFDSVEEFARFFDEFATNRA